MNIHYRIVRVDPAAHGIVVRYFTDKVTEMDLANSLNPDGSVILNADGYPVSTRTDVMMSIYDTPAPSNEELEKRIMLTAPVEWLKLQEDIKDPGVDTKLSEARNLTGDSKSITLNDLNDMRQSLAETEKQERSVEDANATVVNMLDALKVVATENPQLIKAFYDVVNDLKKIAES
jgi:hypothetical protein